jgi:hypothetical protein
VLPRRNCPAVHLRHPALLSAQIQRAECIMVLNGPPGRMQMRVDLNRHKRALRAQQPARCGSAFG